MLLTSLNRRHSALAWALLAQPPRLHPQPDTASTASEAARTAAVAVTAGAAAAPQAQHRHNLLMAHNFLVAQLTALGTVGAAAPAASAGASGITALPTRQCVRRGVSPGPEASRAHAVIVSVILFPSLLEQKKVINLSLINSNWSQQLQQLNLSKKPTSEGRKRGKRAVQRTGEGAD